MDKSTEQVIALLGVNLGGGNLGEEITAATLINTIKKEKPDVKVIEISSNPGDTKLRHDVECIAISRIAEERVDGLVQSRFNELATRSTDSNTRAAPNTDKQDIFSLLSAGLKKLPPVFFTLKLLQKLLLNAVSLKNELLFLVRSHGRLKNIDKVVIAGSGPLADNFGGPLAYPYLVFKWVLLARLRGIPVVFFSVGAVQLQFRLSKYLIRAALNLAEYRSYRDETSRSIATNIGVKTDGNVFPDIAFGYQLKTVNTNSIPKENRIGIGLFPHFDPRYWPEKNQAIYDRYVAVLADFVAWLIHNGFHIVFLSTQVKADVAVTRDVIAILKNKGIGASNYSTPPTETHEEFIKQASQVELMVLTRFHGLIMTLLAETPVIALTNQQKMADLMTETGLGAYMQDIDIADLSWLKDTFADVRSNRNNLIAVIKRATNRNRIALQHGYEDVLRTEYHV